MVSDGPVWKKQLISPSSTGDKDNKKPGETDDNASAMPAKINATTPVSADRVKYASQRAALAALLSNPDREIEIPLGPLAPSARLPSPPAEIVNNVQGSSAGAGSGEFHVYKQARRREFERMKAFDEERTMEQEKAEFEKQREQVLSRDEEKTKKNRERRNKRKFKKSQQEKQDTYTMTATRSDVEKARDLGMSTTTTGEPADVENADRQINLTIVDDDL